LVRYPTMEIILAFGVIVAIWIVAKGRRAPTAPPRRSVNRTSTRATPPISTRDAFVQESGSVTADDCWVPPGRDATVAGYTIRGGTLYVGQGLLAINAPGIEPALIDPSLPVNRANPDHAGAGMTYWPSYSSISPECRAAYLDWLVVALRSAAYITSSTYYLERRSLRSQSEQGLDLRRHCRGRAFACTVATVRFAATQHDFDVEHVWRRRRRHRPPTEPATNSRRCPVGLC
jgi:hypothetical protein